MTPADIGLAQLVVYTHDFIPWAHQILDERKRLHFGWCGYFIGHLDAPFLGLTFGFHLAV